MSYTKLFSSLFLIGILISLLSLKNEAETNECKQLLISFYNVENLFDTIDDPRTNDNDFLPTSKNKWNSEKYNVKLRHLAQVIGGYQNSNFADIVGLCEVENEGVLKDLIKQDSLKKGAYSIIHFDSPDRRGIDVAILYRKKMFKVISSKAITVSDPENNNFKTRDILYVKGINNSKDTLHIFVNHWSSRLGGQEESEGKRDLCASVLRHQVDSLFALKVNAKIVIMGDLNDEPSDESVLKKLKALPLSAEIKSKELYNLCYKNYKDSLGSYYYWKEKDWNMLDNIIVSGILINESKSTFLKVKTQDAILFKPEWLLKPEKDGTLAPYKTFTGKYTAGYSDHLSMYILLEYGCK